MKLTFWNLFKYDRIMLNSLMENNKNFNIIVSIFEDIDGNL